MYWLTGFCDSLLFQLSCFINFPQVLMNWQWQPGLKALLLDDLFRLISIRRKSTVAWMWLCLCVCADAFLCVYLCVGVHTSTINKQQKRNVLTAFTHYTCVNQRLTLTLNQMILTWFLWYMYTHIMNKLINIDMMIEKSHRINIVNRSSHYYLIH